MKNKVNSDILEKTVQPSDMSWEKQNTVTKWGIKLKHGGKRSQEL